MDTKNDGRTWQRSFDGSDRWEFRAATKGSANSQWRYDPSTSTSLVKMITDSLVQSLDMMVAAGTSAERDRDDHTGHHRQSPGAPGDYVIDSIIEIGVYVEVCITDEAGVSGGGFRLSLAVSNGFVREALQWFGNAIVEVDEGPAQPNGAVAVRALHGTAVREHLDRPQRILQDRACRTSWENHRSR